MEAPTSLNPPENMGKSDDIPVISQEQFDSIAADVEKFRESLTEDIPLSKEAVTARNRLFLSALLTVIVNKSTIKTLSVPGFMVLEFNDRSIDDYLRVLALFVTIALAAHYAAAAFSEYLAESSTREERKEGINKRLKYLELAEKEIETKKKEIKVKQLQLDRFKELTAFYKKAIKKLEKQHLIGLWYNIATPLATLVVIALIVSGAFLGK